MALSKLAISLIAGIGSVAAVGGITAGVVVSRQNATQTVLEEEKFETNKEERNKSDSRTKRNSEETKKVETTVKETGKSEALKTQEERDRVSTMTKSEVDDKTSKESTHSDKENKGPKKTEDSGKEAPKTQVEKGVDKQPNEGASIPTTASPQQGSQVTEAGVGESEEKLQKKNQGDNADVTTVRGDMQGLSASSHKQEKPVNESDHQA